MKQNMCSAQYSIEYGIANCVACSFMWVCGHAFCLSGLWRFSCVLWQSLRVLLMRLAARGRGALGLGGFCHLGCVMFGPAARRQLRGCCSLFRRSASGWRRQRAPIPINSHVAG